MKDKKRDDENPEDVIVKLLKMIAAARQLNASLEARICGKPKPPEGDAISLKEAAKILDCCQRTVVRRVEAGKLPARRTRRGSYYTWQFSRTEVLQAKRSK